MVSELRAVQCPDAYSPPTDRVGYSICDPRSNWKYKRKTGYRFTCDGKLVAFIYRQDPTRFVDLDSLSAHVRLCNKPRCFHLNCFDIKATNIFQSPHQGVTQNLNVYYWQLTEFVLMHENVVKHQKFQTKKLLSYNKAREKH